MCLCRGLSSSHVSLTICLSSSRSLSFIPPVCLSLSLTHSSLSLWLLRECCNGPRAASISSVPIKSHNSTRRQDSEERADFHHSDYLCWKGPRVCERAIHLWTQKPHTTTYTEKMCVLCSRFRVARFHNVTSVPSYNMNDVCVCVCVSKIQIKRKCKDTHTKE